MAQIQLEDIKKFVETLIELNNKIVKGADQLKDYEDGLRTGRYSFKQLLGMKALELAQRSRIKKMAKLNNEFIARSEKEKWCFRPGFSEYIASAKDRFCSRAGRG